MSEWQPMVLRLIIESTWQVAYRRAYDDGYEKGVQARPARALPAESRNLIEELLKQVEQVVALKYMEMKGVLMEPRAISGDIFNAIWAAYRKILKEAPAPSPIRAEPT